MSSLPLKEKIGITLSFGIALVFTVFCLVPRGEGSLLVIIGTLFLMYAVLFLATIPMMFWFLLPRNIKNPLPDPWKLMGWLLLIVGYVPGGLWSIYLFNHHRFEVEDYLLIPIFLGPLAVFVTAKIKKHYAPTSLTASNESPFKRKSLKPTGDYYDDEHYYEHRD